MEKQHVISGDRKIPVTDGIDGLADKVEQRHQDAGLASSIPETFNGIPIS